jgi:hypothetical protein
MKKGISPAHREYFLTLVRNNGERQQWYLPYVYRKAEQAQAVADERNQHYKHGKLVVEHVDRPESVSYSGTLRL